MFAKIAKTASSKKNPDKNTSKKKPAKSPLKSEPQIVLFIGLTQNGKSSVIRSILKYAGDEEQAARVERGHDSLSQTKEVHKYSVTFVQKKHFLQYKDGKGELLVVGEDVEEDEVKEKEVLLNKTLSLMLLDSPGLSDSGNPMPKKGEHVEPLPRRMEDERHKLKVLKALQEVGKINSVCFVVKKHQQFGWDFQRHIRDYIDIFEMCSLLSQVNFHVLHTQIDRHVRFQGAPKEERDSDDSAGVDVVEGEWDLQIQSRPEFLWTDKRAQAFDNLTGIKATHHWMDSQPYSKDPVAQYFSKNAISQLMRQLSQDTSAPCTSLRYPKSELHKIHDKELRRSYDNLIFGFQSEKSILETEIQDLEKELRPKIKRKEGYQSEIGGLNSKIYDLDKTTLETITNESKSKNADPLNWYPTLYFRIDTEVTIRKIERNPSQPYGNYAIWIVHSSRDNEYYADYQIKDAFTNAKASVELKGYRSDIYAAEIAKYRKQRSGLQSDLEKVRAETTKLEGEIKEKNTKVRSLSADISCVESEKLMLDGESFALESFLDKAALFLAGGIYSISQAYELERMVAKIKLPRHSIEKQKASHELWTEKRDQNRKQLATKRILAALKQDLAEKTRILKDLEALFTRTNESRKAVEAGVEANLPYELRLPQLNDTERVSYLLNAVEQIQGRGDECHRLLDGVLVKAYTHLEAREEMVHEVLKKMRAMVAKSAAINENFEAAAKKHRVRVDAAAKAIEMFNADEVPIGTFTVLFKGIEKEMSNPYMMLYEDIAECLGEECA
ncbi:hypothetical protein G7Y89_g13558 [Cudoniella acicularis]|uniref:G domain-containing protein n=1 Tax=Cudoniella acicularis TaxID=354080 RepID=A0A8H4VYK3_9HELO|nr:hypothetical protein G7Y89_g13558 [Cudoniella acicularis]